MITIGSTHIATNIFLAPLSGCSDLAFRLIARECGAKFCFFEMVDAHSLRSPHPKKFNILQTIDQDHPIAAQLVGEDPDLILEAAYILLEHISVAFLDINSACPVRKVVKKGAGAALLRSPETLSRIISTLTTRLSLPVTIKIRAGFHTIDIPALQTLVKMCAAHGASALFVHGRTRDQAYRGNVNYEAIRAVKQAVRIPVFGSGDIFTPQLAKRMLDETECDGILVARGASGHPWLFQEIEDYFQHGIIPPEVPLSQKKVVLKRHLAYVAQYKHCTPTGKMGFMRKVALWYIKGFPNASKLRGQVNIISDYDSLIRFIDDHM